MAEEIDRIESLRECLVNNPKFRLRFLSGILEALRLSSLNVSDELLMSLTICSFEEIKSHKMSSIDPTPPDPPAVDPVL